MDAIQKKICDIIEGKKQEIMTFGRDLWHTAELGFKEFQTAEKFAAQLENLGIETKTGLAVTGVKGRLPRSGGGPTVMVEAHLDTVFGM